MNPPKGACRFAQEKGYCAKHASNACPYRHPPLCKTNTQCFNVNGCKFLHENDKCHFASTCSNDACPFRHPKDRSRRCKFGRSCTNQQCKFLHPTASDAQATTTSVSVPPPLEHQPPAEVVKQRFVKSGSPGQSRNRPQLATRQAELLRRAVSAQQRLEGLLNDKAWTSRLKALRMVPKALKDFDKQLQITRNRAEALQQQCYQVYGTPAYAKAQAEQKAVEESEAEFKAQREVVIGAILRILEHSELLGNTQANLRIKRELFRLVHHLPALAKRSELEEALQKHQFIIIKGSTGSGKSTQLPQYLADLPQFVDKKVICTQPRKLAAISLAERVAFEFSAGNPKFSRVGGTVGYRVSGICKTSRRTRIEYTTESSLLLQLNENVGVKNKAAHLDKLLRSCCAIVVDEAHERNMATDLLLGVLKKLARNYPHLRVLITSATMDTALFATYFNDCPLIEIPGRLFPVDIVYKPALDQERSTIDHVLQCVVEITRSTRPSDGDILCFLTGQDEVESAKLTCQRVIDSDKLLKNKAKAFCLYGKQTPEEQREVFTKLGSGVRKIIFATDVAETSLTINGIRYVIDSGLTKDTVFDPNTKLTTLKVMPISKSSATQRKGRAGRTSSGTCYCLYSEDDYEAMKESITPELFRRPLNLLFATLLSMGVDPFAFDWLEPPDANALDNALNELIILKAVTVDNGDKRKELTDLGRAVAELQADPGIVHMLHSSCQRGFGEAACIVAGLLSVANMVFWRGSGPQMRQASSEAHLQHMSDQGDVVSLWNVYSIWAQVKNKKQVIASPQDAEIGDVIEDEELVQQIMGMSQNKEIVDETILDVEPTDGLNHAPKKADQMEEVNEGMDEDEEVDEEEEAGHSTSIDIADDGVEDASQIALEDDEEARQAKSINVRAWCRENFINNKALMMATSTARELRRGLMRLKLWQLSSDQSVEPSSDDLRWLAFNALLLNAAQRQQKGMFRSLLFDTMACVHPSSAVFQLGDGCTSYVVYNSILRTSRVYISTVTPINAEWLKYYPIFTDTLQRGEIQQVIIEHIPRSTLRAVLGKYNSNAEPIGRELNCIVEADLAKGILIAWCPSSNVRTVRSALDAKIEAVKHQLKGEVIEEPLVGGTRIVWGVGGQLITFLHDNEFISVNISNLPASWNEERLRQFLKERGCGEIRECSLLPSTTNNKGDQEKSHTQWVHVVLHDKESARKTKDLKGEVLEACTIDISPGGVKKPSMFNDMKGQLSISFATAPSTGKATLIFSTATEANQVILEGQVLFGRKVWALGHDPDAPLNPKKPHVTKKPDLPPQRGNLFVVKDDSAAHRSHGYKVNIAGLSPSIDEHQILSLLRLRQLPTPVGLYVKRERKKDGLSSSSNGNEDPSSALLVDIAELQQAIPSAILDRVVNRTTFLDEKKGRGGITLFFASAVDVAAAMATDSTVVDRVAQLAPRHAQPIRLEYRFSLSIAIHVALWKRNEVELNRNFKAARHRGIRVQIVNKSPTRTLIDLQSYDFGQLRQLHLNVEKVLHCVIFRHQRKDLLFSWYGRKRLQHLSDSTAYIHWDNRTLTIRIYGNEEEQKEAERILGDLINELSDLLLDQAFIIKRGSQQLLKKQLQQLQQRTNVLDLSLRGSRLMASGTEESIATLQKAVASMLSTPRSPHGGAEQNVCPICLDSFVEQVTLQACAHSFCKACLEGYFSQALLPMPLCCPLQCEPIIVRDLLAFVPSEALERMKQAATEDFLAQHSDRYTRCPKAGCPQYLSIPPEDQASEIALGGRLMKCDQCNATYCASCSLFSNSPSSNHPGRSCKAQQQLVRPTVCDRVNFIRSELLTSSCPACKKAFLDFDGCCAVKCECKAGFCGLCLEDTKGDAHEHVKSCRLNPKQGGYFASAEEIAQAQATIKSQRLVYYLQTISNKEEQLAVLELIGQDLRDLHIFLDSSIL